MSVALDYHFTLNPFEISKEYSEFSVSFKFSMDLGGFAPEIRKNRKIRSITGLLPPTPWSGKCLYYYYIFNQILANNHEIFKLI